MKQKAIPMRRCVGCMTSFPKAALVRVVAAEGRSPMLDASGRAPGRGVYLCRDLGCLEKAMKKKNAFFSLDVSMTPESKERFKVEFESLVTDEEVNA